MPTELILDFYNNWDREFNELKDALKLIKSKKKILHHFNVNKLILEKKLDNHHCTWLKLMSNFQEMEKGFFKPYYVPIEKNIYNFFVDLSDSNLPVFELYFFGLQGKGKYYGIKLFDSIYDILEFNDVDVIEEYYKKYQENRFFLRNRIIDN